MKITFTYRSLDVTIIAPIFTLIRNFLGVCHGMFLGWYEIGLLLLCKTLEGGRRVQFFTVL
jgi:hypothetical protein